MVSKRARNIVVFPFIVMALFFIFSIKVEAHEALAEPEKGRESFAIFVNGRYLSDSEAILVSDRILLPLRTIGEALDAEIGWDSATKKITISKGDTQIKMHIGANAAMINERPYIFDVMPQVFNNRTFVPLRFISEALSAEVLYRDKNESHNLKPHSHNIFVDEAASESPATTKKTLSDIQELFQKNTSDEKILKKIESLQMVEKYSRFFVFSSDNIKIAYDIYNGQIYFIYAYDFSVYENDEDFFEYLKYVSA